MSEDNNNKEKGFSFIQEQITSKKKSRMKRMLYSVAWTTALACVFGVVARMAFCVSEPTVTRFFGGSQDKKTVEFPTTIPDDGNQLGTQSSEITPSPTIEPEITPVVEDNNDDGQDSQDSKSEDDDLEYETMIIEKIIEADLDDLSNIYKELRVISNDISDSIVTVTSISKQVDIFKDEYELIKSTSGLVVADNDVDLIILVSLDKVKDSSKILVSFTETVQVQAKLQAYNTDLNLAAIAVSLDDIPPSNLKKITPAVLGESYSLVVGTPILALGSPNGYVGSMELGIISSKGTSVYITDNKIDTFTTDITSNSNSEGVIVNLRGEVIGIITQKLKDELNPDVNTVIGVSKIKNIIERLVNNSDQVYFGIKGADMTQSALSKVEATSGICITEVEADSPALEGGLQSGDIIVTVNETPILSVNTFYNLINAYEPKATLKVAIKRTIKNETKDMEIEVILGKNN
jgi:serine protease Do